MLSLNQHAEVFSRLIDLYRNETKAPLKRAGNNVFCYGDSSIHRCDCRNVQIGAEFSGWQGDRSLDWVPGLLLVLSWGKLSLDGVNVKVPPQRTLRGRERLRWSIVVSNCDEDWRLLDDRIRAQAVEMQEKLDLEYQLELECTSLMTQRNCDKKPVGDAKYGPRGPPMAQRMRKEETGEC